MSHFGDYMDGVPVKISEKYKRPPRIDLPYSVIECPSRAQAVADGAKYCCTFENNVLAKLKELRSAKETRKNERKHRLQLLEEAKQKKLDLIAAAEAEEKLKQLSVSEVSYPSTEEISEISPDDRTHNCDTITEDVQTEAPVNTEPVHNIETMTYPSCSINTDSQTNILQPIQVMSNHHQSNLLDDPDPLQKLQMNSKMMKLPHYNNMVYSKHNMDKLTYSDFENDTSSPFDNVELKTINDMELLAQVLQSQGESETGCNQPVQQQYTPETYSNTQCAQTYTPQYIQQTQPQMYAPQPPYGMTNGYYLPTETICDNSMPTNDVNMYMPNYQYYAPNNQYHTVDPVYYTPQLAESADMVSSQMPSDQYIPQPYYYNYPQVPVQYQPPSTYATGGSNSTDHVSHSVSSSTMKSRSRSVPDIVNEINAELASAKLRANERSYNASPAPKEVSPRPSSSSEKKSKKKQETRLPNPYDKLSPELQSMCKKIHGMGFPLDRVARVCTLVGDSDKKVIEGLLIMGELMDLGFSESRVSAALAKHEFNRDRALDDLVT